MHRSELKISVYENHQHAASMHGQYRSIHMNMQPEVVRILIFLSGTTIIS